VNRNIIKLTIVLAQFACLIVFGAVRGSADIMLFNAMSVDNYQFKFNGNNMTAEQQLMLNNFLSAPFGDATIYASKKDVCVANNIYSIIIDKKSGSCIVFFPLLKKYMIVNSAELSIAGTPLDNNIQSSKSDKIKCYVTDLHKSDTIVGHIAHKYHFIAGFKDNSFWITGDIWLSKDFPELSVLNSTSLSANEWINVVLKNVKGVPLKLKCEMHEKGISSPLKIAMLTTGLLTHELPPITFKPPHGFVEIKTDKSDYAAQLKNTINQEFAMMLAEPSYLQRSVRSYGIYTGFRKLGITSIVCTPSVFEGRSGATVNVTLVTGKNIAKNTGSKLITCNSHVGSIGMPLLEDVSINTSSGESSKVTVAYFNNRIVANRYCGSSHTQKVIPVPVGLNVYSIGDYASGFTRLKHPNLGWIGVGGVFDLDSMSLKICKLSMLATDATLKDPILGDCNYLTKYSIEIGHKQYLLYDDAAGDVIYAGLAGSISLRRETDLMIAQQKSGVPNWLQLPDATSIVHSDVNILNPQNCKIMLVEIHKPGKDKVLLHIQVPGSIDHGGNLSEVQESKDLNRYLENFDYMSLNSSLIKRQASQIKGSSIDLYEIAMRTCDWVYNSMNYSASTLLLPNRSAEEILSSRQGICRDYAVLYTALMRAEGVPTRLCSGIVDVDNRFYYHEWAETYIGKQYGWVAVDPTLDQHIADATHIVVDYGDNSTPSGTTLHILSAS
jgi:hypothetical protein